MHRLLQLFSKRRPENNGRNTLGQPSMLEIEIIKHFCSSPVTSSFYLYVLIIVLYDFF